MDSDIENGIRLGGFIAAASHDVMGDPHARDRAVVRKAVGYAWKGSYGGWKIKRAIRDNGQIDDYKLFFDPEIEEILDEETKQKIFLINIFDNTFNISKLPSWKLKLFWGVLTADLNKK